MPLLNQTLQAFGDPDLKPDLPDCMEQYNSVINTFNRDFYTITVDKHPELNDSIIKILQRLNVPADQHDRYLDQHITLHELLVELNEVIKNDELGNFIEQIEKRKNARWRNLFLIGVLGGVCGLVPFFAFQLTVLQQVVTVASIMSGVGLIYAVATAAYTVYDTSVSSDVSFYQLFRENFSSVAKNALTIAAWSLVFVAAVTTPVVSGLFVMAEAVLVIKESVSLAYIYLYDRPEINLKSSLTEQHLQARDLTRFETRRHTAWVNFAAAFLMTGIVAAWCFVPGGIFVIAGAVLAMAAVYLVKSYAIRENEKRMKVVLQDRFVNIETSPQDPPIVEPALNVRSDLFNSEQMVVALTAPAVTRSASKTITIDIPLKEEPVNHTGLVENSLFTPKGGHHAEGASHHTPRTGKDT